MIISSSPFQLLQVVLGVKVAVCSKPAAHQVPMLRELIDKASLDVIFLTPSDDLREDPFILPDMLGYLGMPHPSRWPVPTDLYRLDEGCEGAGGRRADQPPGGCGGGRPRPALRRRRPIHCSNASATS